MLVPALIFGRQAETITTEGCDLRAALPVLADPAGLGARPRVIAAITDFGPELLYRTPHSVLAAPYHRNPGILTSHRLLDTPVSARTQAAILERGVGLILLCRSVGTESNTLAAALIAGRVPGWLRPVPLPPAGGMVLFEVVQVTGS
jgi:hypothetical protein